MPGIRAVIESEAGRTSKASAKVKGWSRERTLSPGVDPLERTRLRISSLILRTLQAGRESPSPFREEASLSKLATPKTGFRATTARRPRSSSWASARPLAASRPMRTVSYLHGHAGLEESRVTSGEERWILGARGSGETSRPPQIPRA